MTAKIASVHPPLMTIRYAKIDNLYSRNTANKFIEDHMCR